MQNISAFHRLPRRRHRDSQNVIFAEPAESIPRQARGNRERHRAIFRGASSLPLEELLLLLSLFPGKSFTSSWRGRDDRGRWLRLLRRILLAPQPGEVVLEVADGGVPSGLGRHLAPDAAVDRTLPPLPHARQVTGVCGGLSRPWQRLGDVRQGFPATEFVTTSAFPGGTAAAPLAQDVSQLSEAGSSTALIRRGGLLGIVRRRDRRDLRRGVPSACP